MENPQKTVLLCSSCKTEMKFAEGDVIFEDMWFHKDCASKYRHGRS